MTLPLIIIGLTLFVYLPLASVLMYVWWKYGKDEPWVSVARVIFIMGSFVIFGIMIIV